MKEYSVSVKGRKRCFKDACARAGTNCVLQRNCCVYLGREVISETLEKHSALKEKLILNQNAMTVFWGHWF